MNPSSLRSRQRALMTLSLLLAILASMVGPSTPAHAASFTVTTNADSGPGSLRQAILDANATPGADTITFNIGAGGVQTINLASPLPAVTDQTTIDGTTEPGFNGTPLIELNGGLRVNGIGLDLQSGSNTVRGLVFYGFGVDVQDVALRISGPGNNTIQNNYFGTTASGARMVNGDNAININNSSFNTIGGTTVADRNVISGSITGIVVTGDNNTIQGNYIGTNPAGTAANPNQLQGIFVNGGNNVIGGADPGARNLISGNGRFGILTYGNQGQGNTIQGNYIGTDGTGAKALPNQGGIGVYGNSNLIGGSAAGQGNLISGNTTTGIEFINSYSPSGTSIFGNLVGTAADGTTPLGNGSNGIQVTGVNNVIGGTLTGQGNTIAYNNGDGVLVVSGTGHSVRGNAIFDNAARGIDLSGVGANDVGDGDSGPNNGQNFPVLTRAIPGSGNMEIEGRINSTANTTFNLDFYASPACDPIGAGEGRSFLGSATATTDGNGNATFTPTLAVTVAQGQQVTATATDPNGNTSEFSPCVSTGPGNDSWPRAFALFTGSSSPSNAFTQYLDTTDQSRWYKFPVQPGSQVVVTLTGPNSSLLPANYDLTVYKDIEQAFTSLTSPQDLVRLSAEFAGDAVNPDALTNALNPELLAPEAYQPSAFDPASFQRAVIAPQAFSPQAFSPQAFSPDAYAPQAFSPDAYAPQAFSPQAFSPEQEAYASAQSRSVLSVSAQDGTAPESITLNTWNNTGNFYVRVRGRNGAFDQQTPFTVKATVLSGTCAGVQVLNTLPTSISGSYKTVILADLSRLDGSAAERSALQAKLDQFKARGEVQGVVVDLSSSAAVSAARAELTAHPDCPFAANQLADTIKATYRNVSGLQYVVIVGNDDVIPFFRSPDNAPLGSESDFVPPVLDSSAAQASLRLGYVLSQDAYGSSTSISHGNTSFPVPGAAVGRLVETASEISGMLDAYMRLPGGVAPTPANALVTGYDFMADAAAAVRGDLAAGLGQPTGGVDALISPSTASYRDPSAWTAGDLQTALLGKRHDLVFLAGHFSASSALAADYTSTLTSATVASSNVDLQNTLVWSNGCHSGYNIVNAADVPNVTNEPDWAQAFARKRATLIAGTGYQYGDTDFVAYDERVYSEFAHQLRIGSGPVAIGKALVAAKQTYLATTPDLGGIDDKALRIVTIYGLPMLQINFPNGRIAAPSDSSVVGSAPVVASGPGTTLNLHRADIQVNPSLTQQGQTLTNLSNNTTVNATYLTGPNNAVAIQPSEPVLPLETRNVSRPEGVLRGVGFRGGSYSDTANVLPLVSAPTFDLRGVHVVFSPPVFYPVKPWSVNYFDALNGGATRLLLTPAQFVAGGPNASTGTRRVFNSMNFRLFYSNFTTTYSSGSAPALAAGPSIAHVTATVSNTNVLFSANVVGDPAAGMQEVWVTYTAASGPYAGTWQSLDLVQNPSDSTLWQATLPLNGTAAGDIRYMVQATNGLGLVTMSDNVGAYYTPGIDPAAPPSSAQQPTSLTFDTAPTSGAYNSMATFAAKLTSNNAAQANQLIVFSLGPQSRSATTDSNGRATATFDLLSTPKQYQLTAAFAGTSTLAAGAAPATTFTITKQNTSLMLAPTAATAKAGANTGIVATLRDAAGSPLALRTVFFTVGTLVVPVQTNAVGQAALGAVNLPVGNYTVTASFGGSPAPGINAFDSVYNTSSASGSLTIPGGNAPPSITLLPVVNKGIGSCAAGNTATATLNLTLSDADTPLANLQLSGTSSNQAALPNGNISFGGSGANRTVTFTAVPKANNTTSAVVTLVVSDGAGGTATLTYTVLVGSRNNDTLNGGSGTDVIFALGGNDTINDGDGNDLLCGGTGNTTINGGSGDDTINGGPGNNIIDGGDGNDTINGGDGNDIIAGGNGDDVLSGGAGNDTLTGNAGADHFDGGAGTDSVTDFNAKEGDTGINIP